jgi:hypothetical protein
MSVLRKLCLIIILLTDAAEINSQIVFCPKGAVWHNTFVQIPAWGGIFNYSNRKITYTHDTLIGSDTVKVLSHLFYYTTCYNSGGFKQTFIKQKGDTVFFNNARTQNTWQILYNFAATAGSGWQTIVLKANNTPLTYTYVVDSIAQVVLNGLSLKRLYIQGGYITERYGFQGYLFNFPSWSQGCDGYYFNEFLCYSDSVLGQVKFSEKSCDYSETVNMSGLELNIPSSKIQVGPNPAINTLTIILDQDGGELSEVRIINASGLEVISFRNLKQHSVLNVQDLTSGIYFLLYRGTSGYCASKFIKN